MTANTKPDKQRTRDALASHQYWSSVWYQLAYYDRDGWGVEQLRAPWAESTGSAIYTNGAFYAGFEKCRSRHQRHWRALQRISGVVLRHQLLSYDDLNQIRNQMDHQGRNFADLLIKRIGGQP